MKKLLTIFCVFMAICVANPRASVAVDACQPQSCTGGNEMINILESGTGSTGLCFGCEEGDNDHECDENALIGRKNTDGYLTEVHVCKKKYNAGMLGLFGWNNYWDDASSSAGWCSATEIKPSTFESNSDQLCVYSLDGTTIDYSSKVASLPSGGTPCKICKCKSGKKKNADGTGCEDDTSAQTTCENAPSYGQWDGSTCKCTKDGQQQDEPGKTCKCQDGLTFVVGQDMCVNPNQPAIDDCVNSGGEWDDSVTPNKCVCSPAKGFAETPVNNKCVCENAPNEQYDGNRCVATEQAICTSSGGDWDDNAGTCTCNRDSKHVVPVPGRTPVRCKCESNRYEPDNPPSNGCVLTAQAQREENTFGVLQNGCDVSGGTWRGDITNPSSWQCVCDAQNGLVLQNNVCVCLNEMYKRSPSDSKKCELTDVAVAQRNCTDARDNGENVDWIDAGKNSYCKCRDSNKYYDYGTKTCISSVEQWCNKVSGAHMIGGQCVCKATGKKVPNSGRCPTDTGGGVNAPDNKPNTVATKGAIKTAHEKMAEISNAWGRSRWKTASGNFNGARLASDSVAGVVLGTAGGLITSNVIKKNQVRGGFEDLRCVIGGQAVADWGDQFMVGVQ